jgi:DNA-binding LacI/PurR family transcriptional regulator
MIAGTIACYEKQKTEHTTIIDIAIKMGNSSLTVSRALNNHPVINGKTKEKVRKIAKKLQYSPNTLAQSLKNNRTTTIGVMIPEIKHDLFSSAISGIEEIAYHSGYTIFLSQSNESYEREVLNNNVLMRHRVAGVIVSISQKTKSSEYFKDLLKRNITFVNGMLLHAGLHITDGYESMDSLFKSKLIPDAIFTVNDPVALGACKWIKEAGLKISKILQQEDSRTMSIHRWLILH